MVGKTSIKGFAIIGALALGSDGCQKPETVTVSTPAPSPTPAFSQAMLAQINTAAAANFNDRIRQLMFNYWQVRRVWEGPGASYPNIATLKELQAMEPRFQAQQARVEPAIKGLKPSLVDVSSKENVRFGWGSADAWRFLYNAPIPADFADPAKEGMKAQAVYRVYLGPYKEWQVEFLSGKIMDGTKEDDL
jgi:hypothetical protein